LAQATTVDSLVIWNSGAVMPALPSAELGGT
jgi:hypothetical protein